MKVTLGQSYDVRGLTGVVVTGVVEQKLADRFYKDPENSRRLRSSVVESVAAVVAFFFVLQLLFNSYFKPFRTGLEELAATPLFNPVLFVVMLAIVVVWIAIMVYGAIFAVINLSIVARNLSGYFYKMRDEPVEL